MKITSGEGFHERCSRRWEPKMHTGSRRGSNQHTNRKPTEAFDIRCCPLSLSILLVVFPTRLIRYSIWFSESSGIKRLAVFLGPE